MSAYSWSFGVNGNWSDGTKWSGGVTPTLSDDLTVSAVGVYSVGVTSADFAGSLTFNAASAYLSETTAGTLDIAGALTLDAGTILLRAANTIGSVTVNGGSLELFNASAAGSGTVTINGGELSGMATESIGNFLSMGGSTAFTIDAAAGATVDFGANDWFLDGTASPVVTFGSGTRTGTVVWHTPSASIANAGTYGVNVAGGTLKGADGNFGFLLGLDKFTVVAAGATVDLNGFSITSGYLDGAGAIINSGAAAGLKLEGGDFFGVISGQIAVEIAGLTVFGKPQTYTGATTIDSGQELATEVTGSVAGPIVDNGELANLDTSGTFTAGVISGTGTVEQAGAGTLVLNHANSYSGGTNIFGGRLSIGNASALGAGAVIIDGGELISTATVSVGNTTTFRDNTTLAASAGKTLILTGGTTWDAAGAALNLTFGDAGHTGTVMFAPTGTETINFANPMHFKVAYGTLKNDTSGGLNFLMSEAADVKILASATVDLDGAALDLRTLTSAGKIINSSSALATLYTENSSSITGTVSGKTAVDVLSGKLTLANAETYTGGTTIGSGNSLQLGTGAVTGSIVGAIDDEGALVVLDNAATSLAGVISGAGTLSQSGNGATTLSGSNTYSGGTTLLHGKLIVTNGKALGTGGVTLDNGTELLSTATMALVATQNSGNTFTVNGNTTIAAAHGTTLSIGGAPLQVNAGVMNFGEGANDGTIVFKVVGGSAPGPFSIKVNAGTLKAGDPIFGNLMVAATGVTVAAGATLDVAGFATAFLNLAGAGAVANSSATLAALTDYAGTFGGVISGKIRFETGNVTLTGANTYTGGTLINGGYTLQLGNGGAAGSIVGAIDDEGALVVDESGAVSLTGVISGAGTLTQKGTGVTTIAVGNSYTGGTAIQHGEIVADRGNALGVGGLITLTGGELLGGLSETLSYDLSTKNTVTLAAATGTTVTLNTANVTFDTGRVMFGEGSNNGVIIFKVSSSITLLNSSLTKVEVGAGTLKAGDGFGLTQLLDQVAGTRVDTDAVVDAGGHSLDINTLTGPGTVTNTGAASILTLFGNTTFAGVLTGKWTEVDLFETAILTGNETFTGTAVIEGGTVTLGGLWAEATKFNGGATLILTAPSHFTGTIEAFGSGDTIDLRNITAGGGAVVSYNTGTGVLTVTDGTHTDHLSFAGGYLAGNFAVSADGSGGTDVSYQTIVARAPPPAAAAAAAPAPHRFVSAMAGFAAPTAAALASLTPARPTAHPLLSTPGSLAG